jgi:hypothetical protein
VNNSPKRQVLQLVSKHGRNMSEHELYPREHVLYHVP